MVHRQLQSLRYALQLLFPIIESLVQSPALYLVPLPQSEVRILNGERFQRVAAPLPVGVIDGQQLAMEYSPRPAVHCNVVHGLHEDVLYFTQLQQSDAQKRST